MTYASITHSKELKDFFPDAEWWWTLDPSSLSEKWQIIKKMKIIMKSSTPP